jgi:hypothetical protein
MQDCGARRDKFDRHHFARQHWGILLIHEFDRRPAHISHLDQRLGSSQVPQSGRNWQAARTISFHWILTEPCHHHMSAVLVLDYPDRHGIGTGAFVATCSYTG